MPMDASTQRSRDAQSTAAKDWWRGSVIYQVYLRSFQDSNGDGNGDLAGIGKRLPYIASLGVDAVWITPFFRSPMKDFGYDVSDYRDVDPMFGTLADFDAVVRSAHSLGLKVMIDLVLSHTSDQHSWFAKSRTSNDNPKANWYVWADAKPDGTPPNNWLSIFGGPAWHWDARRCQYYMHNFLAEQPDLNFHEPEVQGALLDVARFWLDRGVDGFRLDTINFYFHDNLLRDNPPLPPERRNASIAPSVNPYNHQEHVNSKNRPENLEFLAKFRALLDEYEARTSVGEIGDAQRGLELLGAYTAADERVHMCYSFEFLCADRVTPKRLKDVFDRIDAVAADGWACWAFSNHDVMRHATRWRLGDAALRLHTTMQMCLRGSVCLYQGEELGWPEAEVAYENVKDPYGAQFWPEFKGRDGCRTPMAWDGQAENAGFGTGKTWLPVSPQHVAQSVAAQETDAGAILHHYRRAIAFRHAHTALVDGAQKELTVAGDAVHFMRENAREAIFCAFNLSENDTTVTVPAGTWQNISKNLGGADVGAHGRTRLKAWQCCIATKVRD